MNKDPQVSKLSKEETGRLTGGFTIHDVEVSNHLFVTNGNCTGGGWGDTNTNCSGTCANCSVNQKPETSNKKHL